MFRTIFKKELSLKRDKVDYEITLKKEEIKSSLLIPIRLKEQYIIKDYLNKMLKKEQIRINKLLITVFLFLISKLRTNKKRHIINYRILNKKTITDLTLLLLIQDIIDQIEEQKYFTKINLKDAFNQIRIKKEDEQKIVFRTRYETFKYLIMSFRLVNVLVTFQRYINQVL